MLLRALRQPDSQRALAAQLVQKIPEAAVQGAPSDGVRIHPDLGNGLRHPAPRQCKRMAPTRRESKKKPLRMQSV